MKIGGTILAVIGVVLMVGAFVYEPAVATDGDYGLPDRIYNLSLGQQRELAFMFGGVLFVSGAILTAVGELIGRLEESGVIKPVAAPSAPAEILEGDERPCAFCDEIMPADIRCSAKDDEQLRRLARDIEHPRCREALAQQGYLRT